MNELSTPQATSVKTVAEMAAVLHKLPLNEKRKKNLLSSLNTTAKLLHCPLADLPADATTLRQRLAHVHPAQTKISAKRLANVLSDLKAAFKLVGAQVSNAAIPKPKRKYSPEWMSFLDGLEEDWQRHTLARLAYYCSVHGYSPRDLTDAILEELQTDLERQEVRKDPRKICKRMAQTWNGAVSRLGHDLPLLTVLRAEHYRAIKLEEFPASFQLDVKAYLSRLEMKDILPTLGKGEEKTLGQSGKNGPRRNGKKTTGRVGRRRPAAAQTLVNVRRVICQFASALVQRGTSVDSITSLAVLVDVENFTEAVRFYLVRNDDDPPSWLWTMLGLLVPIAKYHVGVSPEHLLALQEIRSACYPEENNDLTEKNRARLAQFDNSENFERLLLLPEKLMKEADSLRKRSEGNGKSSSRAGLLAMYAVAIAILLAAPIRSKNLASISLSANLKWHGQGKTQALTLFIPGPTTKNKVTFEGPIKSQVSIQIIAAYLKSYRHLICDAPGDWLFPWPSGGPRAPSSLAEDMCKLIWRKTGIAMHAHLFRHLAGLMWLRHHPGDYETVRQMLNHRKIETTINFYTGSQMKLAIVRYHNEVLSKGLNGK